MAAAQRFFHKTLVVAEKAPQQVTTDGHDSYPRAIREVLGHNVEDRDNAYLNRRIEQVRHQAALLPMLALVRFGLPSDSVPPTKKCGSIFGRVAGASSSSRWPDKDAALWSECKRSKPVSSLTKR
jgi:hypothetical protein